MNGDHWLELLARHCPEAEAPGWDDLIVAYDLGFLSPGAILAWAGKHCPATGASRALLVQAGTDFNGFQAALWEACAEGSGKVPRPGSYRWERAQDRWRIALLKDALAAPLTLKALALAVEAVYELMGCPEDMVGLWSRSGDRGQMANLEAIGTFLQRRESTLVENGPGQRVKTC